MYQRVSPARRRGFTFVEILMVIVIIAVMAALLLGGINKVMALQARTEVMSDITQMAQSLEQAKAGYVGHPEFLPSCLVLHPDKRKYRNPDTLIGPNDMARAPDVLMRELTKQSAAVLQAMFGRRVFQGRKQVGAPGYNASTDELLNWNGRGRIGDDPAILSGPECLVFYLGGMPDRTAGAPPRCLGFSKDPLDPTTPGGSDRYGPYFQFKTHRLANGGPNFFFLHYLDAYPKRAGMNIQPYAYFGAFSPNNYAPANLYRNLANNGPSFINTDNKVLGIGNAYFETGSGGASTRWLHPNKYQILSAGPDRNFGLGGGLNVADGTPEDAGRDNLANFSSTELGNPVE